MRRNGEQGSNSLLADRTLTATLRANQLCLYFATFASSGGDSENQLRRHRGPQGPGRNDSGEEVTVCVSVHRVLLSFSPTYAWKESFVWILANLRAAASVPT